MLFRVLLALAISGIAGCSRADNSSRSSSSSTPPLRVLFIGNSYTSVNDLPTLVTTLGAASGSPRAIQASSVTMAGATLQTLWDEGTAAKVIREHSWDFVVLQEQSLLPTYDPELMYRYARQFDALITSRDAKTLLYLTWARRGKPDMQLALNRAYYTLGKELRARVVAVGPAWQLASQLSPAIALYQADDSHPTFLASYLAACEFYLVLLGNQSNCPVLARPELSASDVATIRTAAAQAFSASH
jgi:hypothetical protein